MYDICKFIANYIKIINTWFKNSRIMKIMRLFLLMDFSLLNMWLTSFPRNSCGSFTRVHDCCRKNTRKILESLTLEQIKSMVPEEWVMRIFEEGGVTTDIRSVWLLVFWGRLTRGGMILIPMTGHHMMHLPPCLDHLPILDWCSNDVTQ